MAASNAIVLAADATKTVQTAEFAITLQYFGLTCCCHGNQIRVDELLFPLEFGTGSRLGHRKLRANHRELEFEWPNSNFRHGLHCVHFVTRPTNSRRDLCPLRSSQP